MANTEGMSDETMSSLLTPSSSSAAPSIIKKKSAFALRQERMRQRMCEPMPGGRPAATVIRPSPPTRRLNTDYNTEKTSEDENSKEEQAPLILGAVLERNVSMNHASKPDARDTTHKSHFSRRQLNRGFPSVHMPIGTFVKKQTTLQPSTRQRPRPQSTGESRSQTNDLIEETSQTMLAQMTCDEIHDNVRELKASLSPEMIAFLQKRGQQKKQSATATTTEPVPTTAAPNQTSVHSNENLDQQQIRPAEKDDLEEKQRVASLLSSVKTSEDLDRLYAEEIGSNVEGVDEVEDDFVTACNLLRSTSPRQTLWAARVVCRRLQADVSASKSFPVDQDKEWPYPTVLAVSLRCLLDNSISQSHGFLLHTYVLQSLYALLQLRAHSDHVVNVSCPSRQTTTSIFQEFFLDDAVPSPPFGTCYPTMTVEPVAVTDSIGSDAVAYATNSSSTSALQDGEAFAKDPMWTLITRMRILPRLTQLLSIADATCLTDEALVAMCGILAMLSVRSMGTASAIAQHPTILPALLRIAVLPPTSGEYSGFFNTRVALPAMLFLCTLARQSRIAAAVIPVDSIVAPILQMSVETDEEHKLQQWSLILWRSVLRYGLGLSSLSTLVSLSIPHLASERSSKYSLAAGFLSAFSNVCYCVRTAVSKPANEWNRFISLEEREVLVSALDWLATTARQTIQHINDINNESDIRVVAARLKFLQSYLSAVEQGNVQGDEPNNNQEEDIIDWNDMVVSLKHVSESKLVEKVLLLIPAGSCAQATLDKDDGWVDVVSTQQEASACSFIDALASLLYTFSVSECRDFTEELNRECLMFVLSEFRVVFVERMNAPSSTLLARTDICPTSECARRGWINAQNFHMTRFVLANVKPFEPRLNATQRRLEQQRPQQGRLQQEPHETQGLVRSHAFSLIGQLQLGEEAFAAVLFSNDILLRTGDESRSMASPLTSFLMQELCATPLSRQQLDHSFKLHAGFGITAKEWGPFDIGTLLSESDAQEARSSAPFSDLLLPMGPLWLWKILSGAPSHPAHVENIGTSSDETEILAACLELLLLLEDQKPPYVTQNPEGARLYYLMNVFLQSERVLRDDRISDFVATLFDRYTEQLRKREKSEEVPLAESFWQACLDHSQISRNAKSNVMDTKDERLLSVLMGQSDTTKTKLRPLIDFVADIAKAYLEFGAQYESFTRCIRLFLSVEFPSQVRCEALQSLREVLHLLTLSEEESDPEGPGMMGALNLCLNGGVIGSIEAGRDSSEFVDLVISVMKENQLAQCNAPTWSAVNGGFFYLFAVASLARNLMMCAQEGVAEDAMRKRLEPLSKETRDVIYESVSRLQEDSDEKTGDIASTVANVVMTFR